MCVEEKRKGEQLLPGGADSLSNHNNAEFGSRVALKVAETMFRYTLGAGTST